MTTKTKTRNFRLTKSDIIAAIYTEPLQATSPGWSNTAPADKHCKVGAVGAVLRYAGKTRKNTGLLDLNEAQFGNVCSSNAYAGESFHLSELSYTYEAMAGEGMKLGQIKRKLTKLVQATFPSRITVSVTA